MGSVAEQKEVHRVRLDTSKIELDLRRGVAKGALSLTDCSGLFASLAARYDRLSELTLENDGLVFRDGSIVSLCFGDAVTARGALKRCQQMFKPPFSLSGASGSDYLVSSASLPKVELGTCDVFGGVFGDNVVASIIEVRAVPVVPDMSRVFDERSGGMDLLTERVGGGDHSANSPLASAPISDPWSNMDECADDAVEPPRTVDVPQPINTKDPWGDTGTIQPDDSADADEALFFLAPPPLNPAAASEPSGSLGVTAKTLSEVFAKHIVYREANGMLAFAMRSSDCVVDYHSYQDNGDEVNAYVCFINELYSAGFAPRSERISSLPVCKSCGLCDETIKVALGLCERQR
jgi:hypothetical protein